MQTLRIWGGQALEGSITISGAKNAALPVLAACVACQQVCRVENCPALLDVEAALDILRHLGADCQRDGSVVMVDPRGICRWDIPEELAGRMRGSVFFMGALMARFGECALARPGGCPLGQRPVDFHMMGLRAMGAEFQARGTYLSCRGKLLGTQITLPYPSVGATENLLMAALGAEGETWIHNAAREPEIVCLCDFLRAGGCRIFGDGTGDIRIIPGLPQSVEQELIPDRMEAATYLCAAAAAGGSITLKQCCPAHLMAVTRVLERAGCEIQPGQDSISIQAGELVSPGRVETGPYPAFPTDAQAPVMAALLRAKGESVICERVFSQRMGHVPGLRSMGGQITLNGAEARLSGSNRLHGASVEATDLRGGAALVAAALSASGETEITGLGHLLRGYEDIVGKLRALGAQISAD